MNFKLILLPRLLLLAPLLFTFTIIVRQPGARKLQSFSMDSTIHSWKRYYALCILILLAHNIYSIKHVWRMHQSVYITHKSLICGYTTYTPWYIHSICTMEDVSCIRGAAYAEQYYDPSRVSECTVYQNTPADDIWQSLNSREKKL